MFKHTNLRRADFSRANIGSTIFAVSSLSEVLGLEDTNHHAPSTVGIDTLILSKGEIPKTFLRGCGLSDWEVEAAKLYNPI